MSKLLINEPKEIGDILIKNRLVRSATFARMASEDGSVNNELVEFYKVLAKGGVGLIVTGLSYVDPSGHGYPNQIGIDRDDLISGLKRISDTIHENGDGCKAVIQLAHNGRQSMMIGLEPIAPSATIFKAIILSLSFPKPD